MGAWWDPATWWGDIQSLGGALTQDAKNFVQQAVQTAVDLVNNGIDWVDSEVSSLGDRVFAAVSDLYNTADRLWSYADRIVTEDLPDWFDNATQTARGWVDDAIGRAQGFANGVARYAESLYNQALNVGRSWVNDAESLARGWVNDAERLLGGLVSNVVDWVAREVLAPLKQDVTDLLGWLTAPIHFVEHELTWGYHLVSSAAGWLEWIAKLPFEGVHDFERLLSGRVTLSNVLGSAPQVTSELSDIERAIAHVFG